VDLVLDDSAKERIIDEGSDFDFGARPLKRAIEKLVEDPLSERVLRGEVPQHCRVSIVTKDGKLDFAIEAIPQPAAAAEPAAPAAPGAGTGEAAPK
jgi:ATP-dependent Clp protease ATP-binding subunit ClpC